MFIAFMSSGRGGAWRRRWIQRRLWQAAEAAAASQVAVTAVEAAEAEAGETRTYCYGIGTLPVASLAGEM